MSDCSALVSLSDEEREEEADAGTLGLLDSDHDDDSLAIGGELSGADAERSVAPTDRQLVIFRNDTCRVRERYDAIQVAPSDDNVSIVLLQTSLVDVRADPSSIQLSLDNGDESSAVRVADYSLLRTRDAVRRWQQSLVGEQVKLTVSTGGSAAKLIAGTLLSQPNGSGTGGLVIVRKSDDDDVVIVDAKRIVDVELNDKSDAARRVPNASNFDERAIRARLLPSATPSSVSATVQYLSSEFAWTVAYKYILLAPSSESASTPDEEMQSGARYFELGDAYSRDYGLRVETLISLVNRSSISLAHSSTQITVTERQFVDNQRRPKALQSAQQKRRSVTAPAASSTEQRRDAPGIVEESGFDDGDELEQQIWTVDLGSRSLPARSTLNVPLQSQEQRSGVDVAYAVRFDDADRRRVHSASIVLGWQVETENLPSGNALVFLDQSESRPLTGFEQRKLLAGDRVDRILGVDDDVRASLEFKGSRVVRRAESGEMITTTRRQATDSTEYTYSLSISDLNKQRRQYLALIVSRSLVRQESAERFIGAELRSSSGESSSSLVQEARTSSRPALGVGANRYVEFVLPTRVDALTESDTSMTLSLILVYTRQQ